MGFYDELLTAGRDLSGGNFGDSLIVTGIVMENWNSENPGTIKVEYLIGEEGKKISGWMRVMTPYCGGGYGYYSLPEVGTEVVVGFIMGDYASPVVLGCLWNEEDKIPEDIPDSDNKQKLWKTKGGHQILLYEEKGKEKLNICTPASLSIELDDENDTIRLTDKSNKNTAVINGKTGSVEIKGDKKIELTCGSAVLTLDGSTNKITIKGNQIDIQGSQTLKAEAQSLKLNGNMTEITAKGSLKAEASGIAQVKGAMLKLN